MRVLTAAAQGAQRTCLFPTGRRRCCQSRGRVPVPRVVAAKADKSTKLWGKIKDARAAQLEATELLSRLLQAKNAKAVAEEHLSSLTEQFFHIASTYMAMAQKEGNSEVYEQMKAALAAALEVKQATLRPEIQLLNKLLAVDGSPAWQQILSTKEAAEQLEMNDGYFYQLLERMSQDVSRQPDGPQKAQLQQKLVGIKEEVEALRRAQ